MFGKKKIHAPATHPVSAIEKSTKKAGGWSSLKPRKIKKEKWAFSREGDVSTYYTAPQQEILRTNGASTDNWRTTVLKPLPIIGTWSLRRQYAFSIALALIGLISAISMYSFIQNSQKLAVDERLEASNIGGMSESLAKNLQRFASGKSDASKELADIQSKISSGIAKLGQDNGGEEAIALADVKKEWGIMSPKINSLVAFAPTMDKSLKIKGALKDSTLEANQLLQKIIAQSLKKEPDEATRLRVLEGLSFLQKMDINADALVVSEVVSPDSAFLLTKNALLFKKYLNDMENGDSEQGINKLSDASAREKLFKVKDLFSASMAPFAASLSAGANTLQLNKKVANDMAITLNILPKKLERLVAVYDMERKSFDKYLPLVFVGLALSILGVGLIIAVYIKEERRLEVESRAALARNQQAVTQLLNELDPVREGDLTKKVTIGDEYTSTIADAINATVEEFGGLVKQIISASDKMSASSEKMGSFSNVALGLSERQVISVSGAADAVTQVEASLQVLARKANDTAILADKSLAVTGTGSQSVKESLLGMMAIKDKVQETSSRVERLKDTSGQIAEILSTIREIAEKTNVLAINANLEAKRAGAAGKGFTVVAQSVQDLAKQASSATSKIGALIDSVQSDIEGAAKSMNETAEDMGKASRLSEATGEAFLEIESASNKLSESIKEMRDTVLKQAEESIRIQGKMNEVVSTVKEANDMNQTANEAAKQVEQSVKDLTQSTKRFIVS